MNFDRILEETGEFGPWQRLIVALLWITAIGDGIQVGMWSITGLAPDSFDCFPPEVTNTSYFTRFDESDLFEKSPQSTKLTVNLDYCSYYRPVLNQTDYLYYPNKSEVVKCSPDSSFNHKSFDLTESATTEFGLLGCGSTFDQLLTSFVQSAFYIGLGIGSFCGGIASDKFGRKKALIVSILLTSGGSLAGAFMPDVWSYMATRLITGIGSEGLYLIGFTMSIEIVGVKERVPCIPWVSYNTLVANCFTIPFAFGQMIPSLVSQITGDWRTIQWTISVASFLLLILSILPESPRWLIANRKTGAVTELVQKIAKKNKRKLSPNVFKSEPVEEEEENRGSKKSLESMELTGGISDMFAPPIRIYSIILFITWPATTLGYFGMNMSMASLTKDLSAQAGLIAAALVEWPAYIVLILFMDIWGRKPLLSYSLIISGVSCIICGFLAGTPKVVLALIGMSCSSMAFNMVCIYTAELYPTIIRNSAIGACSTLARFGAISAPFVVYFLPQVSEGWVQYTIMGVFSAAGGLLALLLPETLGYPLPDTFQDIQEIKKNPKSIWNCNISNVKK